MKIPDALSPLRDARFAWYGLALIGPAIGTLLVVTVGSGWAVLVDACTWLIPEPAQATVDAENNRPTSRNPVGRTWGWSDKVAA